MNDLVLMFHMLSLIADAYEDLKGCIVTMPSGRKFLPGESVNDFLVILDDALSLQSEISDETADACRSLPTPDLSKLN